MKFELYSAHPKSGEKSVTLTAFWIGFIIVMIKIIISDMTIVGKLMPHFSGIDASAIIGALGALYSLRKYSDAKTKNDNLKTVNKTEITDDRE